MRPCILVPGIAGSTLENVYPVEPEGTWVLPGIPFRLDDLTLGPTGDGDFSPTVLNQPRSLISMAYGDFLRAMRGRSDAPVYTFPYDWRVSNVMNGERLAAFVRNLQRRRLPGVPPGGEVRFDFVCHSMGGLIFRNFLRAWGQAAPLPVGRVVFIATPQLGSLEAVEAMVRGGVLLFPGIKAIRKLVRRFPSVYELLPRLPNAFSSGATSLDIFDARSWQSNVTQPSPQDEDVTQERLSAARAVLDNLPNPLAPEYGLQGQVLVIYGDRVDSTLRQVPVVPSRAGVSNWFDFERATRGRGDEVVPVESTVLPGAIHVRIPYEEVSYFREPRARMLNFHSFITELDEVQTITARFLSGASGTELLPLNLHAMAESVLTSGVRET